MVDSLIDGTVPTDEEFQELHDALLKGASWHKPDHYFLLKDFESYQEARLRGQPRLPRPHGLRQEVPDERGLRR